MRLIQLDGHDRALLRLGLPALGALVAEPLYILTDTAVVGRIGTAELAGLAIASSLLLTLHSAFIFLAYGTTGIVARLVGANDDAGAAHHGAQALWLASCTGVVVAAVGMGVSGFIVDVFDPAPAVREEALTYLRVSLLGVPAMLVVLAGVGYLRGAQDTVRPLVVALCTAIGNLVLEIVLIFGLGFGIGASAASTVAAQWAAATAYFIWVRSAARRHGSRIRPERRALALLARVGRDLFVRTVALRCALLATTIVAARIGIPDLAAHQIGLEVWALLALALDAIAIAAQALVGKHLGALDPSAARAVASRATGWAVFAGTVLGVLLLAAAPVVPRAFTDDLLVAQLASFVLVFVAIMQPLNGVVFALDGVLMGAGDVRFLMWSMVASVVVFLPLTWLVLAYGGGLGWLWASLWALMAMRAVPLVVRCAGSRWAMGGTTPIAGR